MLESPWTSPSCDPQTIREFDPQKIRDRLKILDPCLWIVTVPLQRTVVSTVDELDTKHRQLVRSLRDVDPPKDDTNNNPTDDSTDVDRDLDKVIVFIEENNVYEADNPEADKIDANKSITVGTDLEVDTDRLEAENEHIIKIKSFRDSSS